MKRSLLLFLAALAAFALRADAPGWYKGNTHTHTVNSDGNELPRRVVRWYRDYNYHFLVITDHNHLTPVRYLDTDDADDFILIPGEELTESFAGHPAHVCGLGVGRALRPEKGRSLAETLQKSIDQIRADGGLAQVNHPNWKWSFGAEELLQLRGAILFELLNCNRECNNFAAGGRPGMEQIWDRVLSADMRLYGVASDDAHHYLGDFIPAKFTPGRGWVMVRAAALSARAILQALAEGDFYASTGVELEDLRVDERSYALKIRPDGDIQFTTLFIGAGGGVLREEPGLAPAYAYRGDEKYVRAKVVSSAGEAAFCQPYFLKKR